LWLPNTMNFACTQKFLILSAISLGVIGIWLSDPVNLKALFDPIPMSASPVEEKKSAEQEPTKEVEPTKQTVEEKKMISRKIAVFGATGSTGQQVVRVALAHGHNVTAVVRTPAKFQEKHERLKVVQGNVTDAKSVAAAIAGHDSVVSCIGNSGNMPWSDKSLFPQSAEALVAGMKTAGIKRYVTMTGALVGPDMPSDPWWAKVLMRPMWAAGMGNGRQMWQMEQILQRSDLNYTVVRPFGMKNSEPKGLQNMLVLADKSAAEPAKWLPGVATFTSYTDVATFMLDCLENDKYVRSGVLTGLRG